MYNESRLNLAIYYMYMYYNTCTIGTTSTCILYTTTITW